MNRQVAKQLVLISLIILLFAGCRFVEDTRQLPVTLPELPYQWRAAGFQVEWRLYWADSSEVIESFQGTETDFFIMLPKDWVVPVVAKPVLWGVEGGLRSAGAVYPLDISEEDGRLHVNFEKGPVAELLLSLAQSGYDISVVNCRRLCNEAFLRTHGYPWSLDLGKLKNGLLSGKFRVYDINDLDFLNVSVNFPAAGNWISGDPFLPTVQVSNSGVTGQSLWPGRHNYINPTDKKILSVGINESGQVTTILQQY